MEDLQFAFMGTVEARNGPWGVIGDLLYFKLAATGDTPAGLAFSEVRAESKITVLSNYVTYRVYEDAGVTVDLGGGFRAFWTSVDTTFVRDGGPNEVFGVGKNFVDPVAVARLRMAFSEDWFGTLVVDGGGYDGSSTWQALATVGYRINDRWAVQGGYRYMQAEWDTRFGQTSIEFSGPIIGTTFRF